MNDDQGIEVKDSQNTGASMIPQGPRAGKVVFAYLDKILKDKAARGLKDKFLRNYKMTRNVYFKENSSAEVPRISGNMIFRHRTQTVNTLTDNNPTFNVARVSGEDESGKIADIIHKTTQFWWMETEQQAVLADSITNGETYGCCIEKVIFDPEKEYGLGEVDTIVVDPYHFGSWPPKEMDIQKCEAVYHFYPMSVRAVKRMFGEKAKKVKPDAELLSEMGDERAEIMRGSSEHDSFFTTFGGVVKEILGMGTGEEVEPGDEETVVVECWVKDYTMIEESVEEVVEMQNPANGMVEQIVQERVSTRPKYTGFIRKITVANGGDVILEDVSNPSISPELPEEDAVLCYLYDKFPFIREHSNRDTSDPWGMSDIEQIEELQKQFNRTLSQVAFMKDAVVRSQLLNPETSGVANEEFTNVMAVLNPVNAEEALGIKWLEAPQIPEDMYRCMDTYKSILFLVAGTFDVSAATEAGGQLAYKAINALLEQVGVLMRGKIRNYGRLIRERGRMFVSLMFNYYNEDRWISYEEQNGDQKQMQINGTEMVIPARITVVSGSTLPVSKVQQREEAITLFDKGAIDEQELLKKLEYDGWQEIVKRMREGPLGQIMGRLQLSGVPEPLIEYFQQVAQMEEDALKDALRKNEAQAFPQVLEQVMQEGGIQGDPIQEQMQQAELAKIQMEVARLRAEAMKAEADSMLKQEQVVTERVKQQIQVQGVKFDEEKLQIERAKVVSQIKEAESNSMAKGSGNRPGYNERGLKSNNVEG